MNQQLVGEKMKKRRNKWAIFMWVIAAIFLVQAITALVITWKVAGPNGRSWLMGNGLEYFFASVVRPAFFSAPMLIGLGVLIEMVDCMRWDGMTEEARSAIRSRQSLLSRFRAWPG